MSSYAFPLDNLFDRPLSSAFSLSRLFDLPSPVEAPRGQQVTENRSEEQMLEAQLRSFETVFQGCEYGDESLSDVVLKSSCQSLEPKFDARIARSEDADYADDHNILRRACSTGDLSNFMPKNVLKTQRSFSNPLPVPGEDSDPHRAGRYSAEQRRMSIDKYRAKRSLRNFNKTIKYECRKTLADNRPRIRGRFKRNEETADKNVSKSPDEDVIWMERFHAMSWEESGVIYGGQILGDYGQAVQFGYPSSFS
uniref:CCT domain-containing protein n=1 Tax=Kalanchoe fedtschenkoi TaxID=63787 RepID=A0A7N0U1Q6_KALFE